MLLNLRTLSKNLKKIEDNFELLEIADESETEI